MKPRPNPLTEPPLQISPEAMIDRLKDAGIKVGRDRVETPNPDPSILLEAPLNHEIQKRLTRE